MDWVVLGCGRGGGGGRRQIWQAHGVQHMSLASLSHPSEVWHVMTSWGSRHSAGSCSPSMCLCSCSRAAVCGANECSSAPSPQSVCTQQRTRMECTTAASSAARQAILFSRACAATPGPRPTAAAAAWTPRPRPPPALPGTTHQCYLGGPCPPEAAHGAGTTGRQPTTPILQICQRPALAGRV